MLNGPENDLFIWRHFLRDHAGTVIVLPSPHGDYKSGISYSDARAVSEVYAKLQNREDLHVQSPETLVDGLCTNLIIVAGKKANRLADDFQSALDGTVNFHLEDGVISDKEKPAVITPKFLKGSARSIENITVDYGLIRFMKNPFEPSKRVLQIGGIKGHGTLAAAAALTKERYVQRIQQLLRQEVPDSEISNLLNKTVEFLVKVSVRNGRIQHDSVTIEKIVISDGAQLWKWESAEYERIKKTVPHRLDTQVSEKSKPGTSVTRVTIDGRRIGASKSADRYKIVHVLARQAKDDYLNHSENRGWMSAVEVAEKVWEITLNNGLAAIPTGIRNAVSSVIAIWARNLEKHGKLRLDESIKLDRDYINDEILVFDFDVKKKVVDLVHLINQDVKKSLGFQLIESIPTRGYRINIHPALIFENPNRERPLVN